MTGLVTHVTHVSVTWVTAISALVIWKDPLSPNRKTRRLQVACKRHPPADKWQQTANTCSTCVRRLPWSPGKVRALIDPFLRRVRLPIPFLRYFRKPPLDHLQLKCRGGRWRGQRSRSHPPQRQRTWTIARGWVRPPIAPKMQQMENVCRPLADHLLPMCWGLRGHRDSVIGLPPITPDCPELPRIALDYPPPQAPPEE